MRRSSPQNYLQSLLLISALPLASIALTPPAAQAISFSGIYVFGDSLSDTGNTFAITQPLTVTQPPLLPFPVPPAQLPTATGIVDAYFDGRFSDGEIWIDFLAEKLAVPTPPNSFAYAGLTTGSLNTSLPFLPGLQQVINGFTQAVPQADPNALYILWAGANDYLGGLPTLNPIDPVAQPVANLVSAIEKLAGIGAKNILVANLPDIGKAPLVAERGETAIVSALVGAHNVRLAQALAALDPTLAGAGVSLIPLDLYSLVEGVVANPTKFGFTNVSDACLYPSPLFYNPLPAPLTKCSDPAEYLFWDSLHPTSAAHQLIGELAYTTLAAKAVPEPAATVGLLLAGLFLGSANYLKRRQKLKALACAFTNAKAIVEAK